MVAISAIEGVVVPFFCRYLVCDYFLYPKSARRALEEPIKEPPHVSRTRSVSSSRLSSVADYAYESAACAEKLFHFADDAAHLFSVLF